MKSEYTRLAHQLDQRTLALAVKIADSCARSDIETNCPWFDDTGDEGVAGEIPRDAPPWYDTAQALDGLGGAGGIDPEDRELIDDALAYLEGRGLLIRKEGATHLVRVVGAPAWGRSTERTF